MKSEGRTLRLSSAVGLAIAAFWLLWPAAPAQAAPPTFVSVSAIAAAANGVADPQVTLPGHLENDVILLSTIARNSSTVATPAGWTPLGSALRGTVRYQFFWIRAGASAVPNPTIDRTLTTGDVYAAAAIYRGAIPTGDPWEVKGTIQTATTDPVALTGITTLTAQSLLVVAVSGEDDNNAAITLTAANAPTALTEHYLESATGASGQAVITFSEVARTAAGATGAISANWGTANPVGSGSLVLALKPTAAFEQAAYRFFNNADSANVGAALAAQDSVATLGTTGAAFRLRLLLHASLSNHAANAQAFKLQFVGKGTGTCAAPVGGIPAAYTDVTAATAIAFNDNASVADGVALTANGSDPTHGADTVVSQTYEESGTFNNANAINAGQDGKWDFSLIDNSAQGTSSYCFRVVTDAGVVIDTYTVYPEITTARGTVFYLHDATTPNAGTLPGLATLSSTTPDTTALNASINRDMNQAIGVAAVNPTIVVGGTALQEMWFRRFVSRPLATQTLPTGIWAVQAAASESNTAANMNVWGVVLKVWRPSDGSTVATLLDDPMLGTVEPGTVLTNVRTQTGSIAGVGVVDGDVLILELWVEKNNATSRTYTINYDGTTEGATGAGASNAAFLEAPRAIAFHRNLTQSAYRFFANADSTNVGTALAAQDAVATLGSGVSAFRLRTLLHVSDINLAASGQSFKLQFAGKGAGTCAAPSGTPGTYTDVTGATLIAFNNNPTPADGANLTANGSDPIHGAHTVVNQTYEEANNFTNTAAVNAGQDGKWDFALMTNGVPVSTTYCFRVVRDSGTALDFYTVYPEITTPAVPTPATFNAVEPTTAVTGVIKTKIAGTGFNLDVVAISGGIQHAGFTDAVMVDLLGNNTLGVTLDAQNCPTSSTVVQSVANPTITGGRVTVAFAAVANAWRDVRVRVRWPVPTPSLTWCSTDNFAIRPAGFAVSVTDNDWETATPGTSRTLNNVADTGGNVHKAGRPFRISATAQTSGGATTSNYSLTPSPVSVTRVLPTVGECSLVQCSLGTLSLGTFSNTAGVVTTTDASYNEAGSISMTLEDQNWSSVDNSDGSSTAERHISFGPFNVGRFVPDHFRVSAASTPLFRTYGTTDASCQTPPAGNRRVFTYVGQTFGYTAVVPVTTFTAMSANGTTVTANYATPSLFHTASISATQTYTPAVGVLARTINTPLVAAGALGSGTGTITSSSSDTFTYVRDNSNPQNPFTAAISLDVSVTDTSEAGANQGNITTTFTSIPFPSIGFDSGNSIRYGRLRLQNAAGSGLADLPVPMTAQYWDGGKFVTNTDDHCTSIGAAANVTLSPYTGGVNGTNLGAPGHISLTGGAIKGGIGFVRITKPSPALAAKGTATPTVNLVGESKTYLQGNWTGSPTYNVNPSARAAFGVFGAQPRSFIFNRENH